MFLIMINDAIKNWKLKEWYPCKVAVAHTKQKTITNTVKTRTSHLLIHIINNVQKSIYK